MSHKSRAIDVDGNIIWERKARYSHTRWTNSSSIPSEVHNTRRPAFTPTDHTIALCNEIKRKHGMIPPDQHESMSAETNG